jgi:hypothetical protein
LHIERKKRNKNATKMQTTKAAQSTTNIPTVQERIAEVAQKLVAIKESATTDAIERAAEKVGISTRTAKEYLKGNVAFLHRGNKLYKELVKNIKAAA